jgi:hypothetical protein
MVGVSAFARASLLATIGCAAMGQGMVGVSAFARASEDRPGCDWLRRRKRSALLARETHRSYE